MSAEPEGTFTTGDGLPAETEADALPLSLRERTPFQTRGELWQAVQHKIKEQLGLERFSVWFRQTELMGAHEDRLVVGVPNVVIQQFLSARYTDAVADAAAELIGGPMQVSFEVGPRLFREMRARRTCEPRESEPANRDGVVSFHRARAMPRVPAEWGFERLIVSRANRLPFAAARELAGQENPRFQLLYVCGDYGTGKTALLRAIFALASAPERGLEPIYMAAEDWCNEYYLAIQRKTTHRFRDRYRSRGMLLLDDVQFLQGKAAGQGELLHTVKHILGRGGRVALSSALHPGELKELAPALLSLLRSAFPAVLLPARQDERLDVVKQLSARRGLDAVEEVHRLIAQSHGDSFATMESAVCCLALYAGLEGRGKLELCAAQDALAAMHPATPQPVGPAEIKEAVLDAFPVSAEQLTGRSRSRTVCRARQVAIYLARGLTDASLTEIGRAFGGLTHSTVKHAADKIARNRRTDPQLASLLERLERRLGAA